MSAPDRPAVLASDADREQSVALLREATVEGRITLEEFTDRVGHAQLARTHNDLAALVEDLPCPTTAVALAPRHSRHVAFCSRLVRRGRWELAARSSFRSIFGTIDLDLREATLAGPEIDVDVFNLFGTVTVIVPEGISVEVDGGGLFASQVIQPSTTPPIRDAPKLRIHLSGPGGTLYVQAGKPSS
jgi:Domain of unknown function (DUF1707)/Cell wall-active antibiotics response 4TMS YvqF